MMKRGWDIWDVLILGGALLIIFWAVLKAIGILQSPVWVEMIPYIGGGLSIIGGAYKLGKIKRGIDDTEYKVEKLVLINERFGKVEHEHNLAMLGMLKLHE